jgi:hypothetical protein
MLNNQRVIIVDQMLISKKKMRPGLRGSWALKLRFSRGILVEVARKAAAVEKMNEKTLGGHQGLTSI